MYRLQRWTTSRVNSGTDVTFIAYLRHYTKVVHSHTCIPVRETPGRQVQLEVDQSHNQAKECIDEYLHEGEDRHGNAKFKVLMAISVCDARTWITKVIGFLTKLLIVRNVTMKSCKWGKSSNPPMNSNFLHQRIISFVPTKMSVSISANGAMLNTNTSSLRQCYHIELAESFHKKM